MSNVINECLQHWLQRHAEIAKNSCQHCFTPRDHLHLLAVSSSAKWWDRSFTHTVDPPPLLHRQDLRPRLNKIEARELVSRGAGISYCMLQGYAEPNTGQSHTAQGPIGKLAQSTMQEVRDTSQKKWCLSYANAGFLWTEEPEQRPRRE